VSLIQSNNRWLIAVSFVVVLLLMVFPLPQTWLWSRPELLALLVIYWVTVLPQQLSMLLVCGVGGLQDLLEGSVFGQHALALLVVAYVCLLSYQRIRNYSLLKQSFFVFIIVGLHQLIDNWVHSLNGSGATSLIFLLPAVMSALIWPGVWLYLEKLRRTFHIS